MSESRVVLERKQGYARQRGARLFLQYVLKGINGINAAQAEQMLKRTGIACNWWRTAGSFSVQDVAAKLTPANLDRHLRRYGELDPRTGQPFSNQTPFISTTAGTVEADIIGRTNYLRPAMVVCSVTS